MTSEITKPFQIKLPSSEVRVSGRPGKFEIVLDDRIPEGEIEFLTAEQMKTRNVVDELKQWIQAVLT